MSEFIPFPLPYDDVPIDISFVFENERPAGKHGFLKTEGRNFVFEDGTRVAFWGTNFNGAGCFPEHGYAEMLAKRLAKIGKGGAELVRRFVKEHGAALCRKTCEMLAALCLVRR